jgi:hypothetical protein
VKHRASAPTVATVRARRPVAALALAVGLCWPAALAWAQAAAPAAPGAATPGATAAKPPPRPPRANIPNLSSRQRNLPTPTPAPAPGAPMAMPPGHGAARNPHGSGPPQEPIVNVAPDLAPGQIEVRVIDRRFRELGGRTVTLKVLHQSIERGNTESTVTAVTDDQGIARFAGQGTESDYQYQVLLEDGPAKYPTPPFGFSSKGGGIKVFVPMFEYTRNLNEAIVLSRALVVVVPRDESFTIEVLWRVENFGQKTWVPENVVFKMPPGFKALQAEEMKGDGRFENAGDEEVKLTGTFPPGKHDLMFRFQLPNEGKSELSFAFPTFLHVGLLKVMVDVSPTMTLSVPGFSPAEETRNREGQKRLVTGRDFLGEKIQAPPEVQITIAGIPTPSKGRSVAAGIAAAIALAGLGSSVGLRRRGGQRDALTPEDLQRAEELLLNELVELEQAFARGTIGRKMRDRTRQQLLEAFARLGANDDAEPALGAAKKPSTATAV